jgi:hypothetical protein
MKTQLQKPSAGKARYTPGYKHQALEKWRLSGRSAAGVAAEFGIQASLLQPRRSADENAFHQHPGVAYQRRARFRVPHVPVPSRAVE